MRKQSKRSQKGKICKQCQLAILCDFCAKILGILAFKKPQNDKISYILIATFGYLDFIKSKYGKYFCR
ncbi:hypothetical protein [Helicobacter sp. T3_23-1056]